MKRVSSANVVLELTAVLSSIFVVLLILLRGRWLLPGTTPLRVVVLGLLLGVLVLRVRPWAPSPGRRPALVPGRWLDSFGAPELVLAGAFLLVLALLPIPASAIGADGHAQLEQLGDVLLRGHLASHPGLEPGGSVLWTPFFLVGHLVAVVAGGAGVDVPADGFSDPYRNAIRLGAAFFGLLAAVLAHRVCRRLYPALFAAVCVAGVWLSSSLFHYTVSEPAMAHAPAAAAAALLLLLWLRAREAPQSPGRWLAVAFTGGLLVSVQRYDIYLLLGPVLSGAAALRAGWARAETGVGRRTALALSGAGLVFFLGLLPLVLLTFATPERFLLSPEVVRATMLADWSHPHVVQVLFSSNGGLLAWTPVALLGIVGLVLLVRRDRALGLSLLATVGLGVYLLSSNPQWWGGWSFGARRMTEAFALFALGFCAFSDSVLRRPRLLGVGALGLLVGGNILMSRAVSRGVVPQGDTVSFARAVQAAVADFYGALGHPPSWPANWIFAWNYGVSPDRFDELYGRVPRERWEIRPGSPGEAAVLGRGWVSKMPGGAARQLWAKGSDATLLFTLPAPADRRLHLRAAAAPHPQRAAQGLVVEVNGRPVVRAALPPGGTAWDLVVPASAWRRELNEVVFRPTWTLSRSDASGAGVPPFSAWRLDHVVLVPVAP